MYPYHMLIIGTLISFVAYTQSVGFRYRKTLWANIYRESAAMLPVFTCGVLISIVIGNAPDDSFPYIAVAAVSLMTIMTMLQTTRFQAVLEHSGWKYHTPRHMYSDNAVHYIRVALMGVFIVMLTVLNGTGLWFGALLAVTLARSLLRMVMFDAIELDTKAYKILSKPYVFGGIEAATDSILLAAILYSVV